MSFLAALRPDLCHRLMTHPGIVIAHEDLPNDEVTGYPPTNCSTMPSDDPAILDMNCEWIVSMICLRADEAEDKGGVVVIDRLPYLSFGSVTAKMLPFVPLNGPEQIKSWLLGLAHFRRHQIETAPKRDTAEMVYYA